jgi:MFS superfamily sulfate permease-like transporter
MKNTSLIGGIKENFPSGLVVFLVALPLCLGIALASGAPPLSGIIAGIVGGLVVGSFSNSNISVSGPAAGLTAIVLTAITDLVHFPYFFVPGLLPVLFSWF